MTDPTPAFEPKEWTSEDNLGSISDPSALNRIEEGVADAFPLLVATSAALPDAVGSGRLAITLNDSKLYVDKPDNPGTWTGVVKST